VLDFFVDVSRIALAFNDEKKEVCEIYFAATNEKKPASMVVCIVKVCFDYFTIFWRQVISAVTQLVHPHHVVYSILK